MPPKHRPAFQKAAAALEPDLSLASWHDAERLFRGIREALVTVDQPLALVSSTQRSGGTLVNNLLDGHPQLHSHPFELHIGHPTKDDWPILDLAAGADSWLELLREQFISRLFANGYRKHVTAGEPGPPNLPFTIAPSFLERLFRVLCAEQPPRTAREIVDRYLTAFFNAWIDCQGLREGPKLWVSAFCPRLAWSDSRVRFLADYPDGLVIVNHRDPRAWYASASHSAERYGALDEALALWRRGAEELLTAKAEDPLRVFVLTYEALVTEPKRTMSALADRLGIEWHPILVEPTFNRLPTLPNSSFEATETGIRTDSVDRWRDILPDEAVALIEAETLALDAAVRAAADVA
jgi:sulfotransferase family protein